ncbi:hypothetical protein BH10CYA1_BH10CYA1_60420 [soil metagenome]
MTNDPPTSDSPPRPNKKRVDPLVGTVLDDRFEIEEVLGSGGMSVVYKANQLRVNRHVAVKTLRMQLDSKPIYRERFQNEINLLCALSHPNIVTVYDCVIGQDDQPYVIMDYLRGRSLDVLIGQDGPMSVERFLRISVQVCGALDHAHRKGVIHRDLKPGNIVLMDDESDFVKVVDFGLAKLNVTNRRLTQSGELWGSPPYMSPEHCQSKPEDERSDLYSFGAVMYEMLTGKDPFHFATSVYELIQIHINTQPPSLAEANPLVTVPADLEAVIFKAMAKLPEDRYQTASQLRDALIAVSGGANGRHSGDLLSLPTPSKSRSNSTGEISAPTPSANISATEANNSPSASEHFRRALDPMKGINVDQLFEGTADSAEISGQVQPSILSQTSPLTKPSTLAQASTNPPASSSVRRMQSAPKPLVTPVRVALVAALCVIACMLNALPNFLHPVTVKPAPNSIAPQSQPADAVNSSTSVSPSAIPGKTPNSSGPVALEQNNQTTKKTPETVPTTHSTTATKLRSPLVVHRVHTVPSGAAHATPAHSSPHSSHPTGSAKSSNPWDALQGLRKGK